MLLVNKALWRVAGSATTFMTLLAKLAQNVLITARKRSLGQSNIFTPVCHSVHSGGSASVHAGIPPPPPGTRYTPPRDQPHPPGPDTHTPPPSPWEQSPLRDQAHTPPGPGRHGQRAGGTHPTGMQSCFHSHSEWNCVGTLSSYWTWIEKTSSPPAMAHTIKIYFTP